MATGPKCTGWPSNFETLLCQNTVWHKFFIETSKVAISENNPSNLTRKNHENTTVFWQLSFDEKNSWKHNGGFDNFHLTRKIRENTKGFLTTFIWGKKSVKTQRVFWQLSFEGKKFYFIPNLLDHPELSA